MSDADAETRVVLTNCFGFTQKPGIGKERGTILSVDVVKPEKRNSPAQVSSVESDLESQPIPKAEDENEKNNLCLNLVDSASSKEQCRNK